MNIRKQWESFDGLHFIHTINGIYLGEDLCCYHKTMYKMYKNWEKHMIAVKVIENSHVKHFSVDTFFQPTEQEKNPTVEKISCFSAY